MFYSPEVFWITIRCHSVGFASDARRFCPMVACAWKFAGLLGGYPSGRRCDHQMWRSTTQNKMKLHGQQKWNYCLYLFHSIYIRHRIIQTWYIYIYISCIHNWQETYRSQTSDIVEYSWLTISSGVSGVLFEKQTGFPYPAVDYI